MKHLVAVYGTLKKGFSNNGVMVSANGKFIGEDYVPFKEIDGYGFPRIKFQKDSRKLIKVELYEVEDDGVLNNLDRLEGYTEGGINNHYNRIKVNSLSQKEVSVYEINGDVDDISGDFLEIDKEDAKEGFLYYNWY